MKIEHEIRDPVHTFIRVDNDERSVLDSEPVQRLRDVHQLALTYLVYPGASHKRFEHSLGVMELAGRVFDIVTNPNNLHQKIREQFVELHDEKKLSYWKRVIRLAALCHDIGHLPFSHAAEAELLPNGWTHERLSRELILSEHMSDLWENMKPPVTPEDVAKLAVGRREYPDTSFSVWETILSEIIVGDAFGVDRIDYLLRDSVHTGVAYGRFDHYRLIDTLRILPSPEDSDEPQLGVTKGGIHSAEALLLARYFMFTQVYFHPVRRAFDSHLKDFLRQWLSAGRFSTDLAAHLRSSDGNVLEAIRKASADKSHAGHEPALRIRERNHFRKLWESNPVDLNINADAGEAIFNAAIMEFGEDAVRRDRRTPSGPLIDFPVELDYGNTASAQDISSVLQSIPVAAFDYVLIAPEKAPQAKKWLGEKRNEILEASLVREDDDESISTESDDSSPA